MYREVSSSEFKNKEILLRALKTNSLSLRMTCYVYEPEVKVTMKVFIASETTSKSPRLAILIDNYLTII